MLRRSLPRAFAFVAASIVAASAGLLAVVGCPPPPPPPAHDAGTPDGGTGAAGELCAAASFTHACALGLECNAPLDAGPGADGGNVDPDGGVFAEFGCGAPGDVDAGCHFVRDADPVKPPDDGCKSGLKCGSSGSCALQGIDGTPCTSPTDCASEDCGRLADNSASVCVQNQCFTGCPGQTVCQQQGQCGQICTTAASQGQACFTNGSDACSPVTIACADGLQCYSGDVNTVVVCALPGHDGDPCNPDTPQQGCLSPDVCDGVSRTCINPNP